MRNQKKEIENTKDKGKHNSSQQYEPGKKYERKRKTGNRKKTKNTSLRQKDWLTRPRANQLVPGRGVPGTKSHPICPEHVVLGA